MSQLKRSCRFCLIYQPKPSRTAILGSNQIDPGRFWLTLRVGPNSNFGLFSLLNWAILFLNVFRLVHLNFYFFQQTIREYIQSSNHGEREKGWKCQNLNLRLALMLWAYFVLFMRPSPVFFYKGNILPPD